MGFPHGNAGEREKSFSAYVALTDDWMKGKQQWQFPAPSSSFARQSLLRKLL